MITVVLRLWHERSELDPAASEWRGELKQVPSGAALYFRGLNGLQEQLVKLLDARDER